jgi:hypothetical protein
MVSLSLRLAASGSRHFLHCQEDGVQDHHASGDIREDFEVLPSAKVPICSRGPGWPDRIVQVRLCPSTVTLWTRHRTQPGATKFGQPILSIATRAMGKCAMMIELKRLGNPQISEPFYGGRGKD